jgi:hypothetical protein
MYCQKIFAVAPLLICLICQSTSGAQQGFDPQAVAAWQAAVEANAQKFKWSATAPQANWPCPPLRVIRIDNLSPAKRVETFQLLGDKAIYTRASSERVTKNLFLTDRFYEIQQNPTSDTWILKMSVDRDGEDDWNWDPGNHFGYSATRTTARTLVDRPIYTAGVLTRLDQVYPAISVQLISETNETQVYRISPSDGFDQSGEIILSKVHGYRPIKIYSESKGSRGEVIFRYESTDFSDFEFAINVHKEADIGDATPHTSWTIKIDDQASPEEFDLAYYGIKIEPKEANSFMPNLWWLILGGVALIGIAVWVRRTQSRS